MTSRERTAVEIVQMRAVDLVPGDVIRLARYWHRVEQVLSREERDQLPEDLKPVFENLQRGGIIVAWRGRIRTDKDGGIIPRVRSGTDDPVLLWSALDFFDLVEMQWRGRQLYPYGIRDVNLLGDVDLDELEADDDDE